MSGRPCKPGSDLHGLWRLLLPGTAFPACGVPEDPRPIHPSGSHWRRTRATTRLVPTRASRSAKAALSIRLGAPQSPLITSLIESALMPESSTVNGAAARSNFTLLRMPSQPSAPLNAVDFTACPTARRRSSLPPTGDLVAAGLLGRRRLEKAGEGVGRFRRALRRRRQLGVGERHQRDDRAEGDRKRHAIARDDLRQVGAVEGGALLVERPFEFVAADRLLGERGPGHRAGDNNENSDFTINS